MSGVLVFSERPQLAFELLTGGRAIAAARGSSLTAALLGDGAADRADDCLAHGAQTVFVAGDPALAGFEVDTVADALAQIVRSADADLVLVGSSRRGRILAPRLAQKLEAGCVTDAKSLQIRDGRPVTERLALGGNTMKEEAITVPIGVIAVAPGTFEANPAGQASGEVVTVSLEVAPSRARVVERRPKEAGAVDIESAERLVCIGRGVASRDDLPLIDTLAAALGAEVAATRPLAYEYEWLPEDRMVGISGKTVSPELYVVVGSSGQIQHTVSVRDSRIIVAVNKDKNAPIFKMADYGIVGDLYEIVPRLTEALGGGTPSPPR